MSTSLCLILNSVPLVTFSTWTLVSLHHRLGEVPTHWLSLWASNLQLCPSGPMFLPVWAWHNGNLPSKFYGKNFFLPRILTQTNDQDWLHFQTHTCSVTVSPTHSINRPLGDAPHQSRDKLRETNTESSGNWNSKKREAKGIRRVSVRRSQRTQVWMRRKDGCLPEREKMADCQMPFAFGEEIYNCHREFRNKLVIST